MPKKLIIAFAILVHSVSFAKQGIVEVSLSTKGNDVAFDQTTLQVPMQETIRIKFVNKAAEGSEISHNVAILKPGTEAKVIAALQKSDYNREKILKHRDVLVATKTLDPGEADEIVFKPTGPGFYPYICFVAGHADMLGMKGILHVKSVKKEKPGPTQQ